MLQKLRIAATVLVSAFLLSACEKAEKPFQLPSLGTSQFATVKMGQDYTDQVYFNFETGTIAKTSLVASWDLAFESSKEGFHVFMNGAKNIFVFNTRQKDGASVLNNYISKIKDSTFAFDAPCAMPDSTGVGDWRQADGSSKGDVYIVKMSTTKYKKIIINSVSDAAYSLSYGDLASNSLTTISIPKNPDYNYAYFTFDDGGSIVYPEPPKATWDIVFTRYRYIYYDMDNFPYQVSGVLLNPTGTSAVKDSTVGYAKITYQDIANKSFSHFRDVIGFDWKSANINEESNTAIYTVQSQKTYVVKTQRNQYWKLHFTYFYDANGVKGSPSFEFERIQ